MNIGFGDVLTFTDEWYEASGRDKPQKPIRLLATGKITEQEPDCLITVVKEGTSYIQTYHQLFMKRLH